MEEMKKRFLILDKLKIKNESIINAKINEKDLSSLIDDLRDLRQALVHKLTDSKENTLMSVKKLDSDRVLFIEISKKANDYIINAYVIDKESEIITQKITLAEADRISRSATSIVNRLGELDSDFKYEKELIDLNEFLKNTFYNNISPRSPPEGYEDYTIDDDFDIER